MTYKTKVEEPSLDSLRFKQLSMAFIETCLRNVWLLKIKSAIGPLSIIGMRLARELGAGSGERGAGKKRAGSRDCRKKSRNR
jgi:hypothetical protein